MTFSWLICNENREFWSFLCGRRVFGRICNSARTYYEAPYTYFNTKTQHSIKLQTKKETKSACIHLGGWETFSFQCYLEAFRFRPDSTIVTGNSGSRNALGSQKLIVDVILPAHCCVGLFWPTKKITKFRFCRSWLESSLYHSENFSFFFVSTK